MFFLAGHAALSRGFEPIDPNDKRHWLNRIVEDGLWQRNEAAEDINKALRLAQTVRGEFDRAVTILCKMASWTDQAMHHPKLWAVVVALAEELSTVKARMGGKRACSIMDKTWVASGPLPYMAMGYKWRRRFKSPTLEDRRVGVDLPS